MTTMLVDGNNLLMRAVFAMRMTTLTAGGRITAPTHVFITSLSRLIRDEQPDRILVCWDSSPSWRVGLSSSYKAHRPQLGSDDTRRREDSFDLVQRFCALAGIPQLQREGQEADDLIAGAWASLTNDDDIVIVSSDKDLLQLLGPNPWGIPTSQIRLSSHDTDTDLWTEQTLIDKQGLEPEQVPLVMALTGDTADGVGGIPGIGLKKAQKLFGKCGWDFDAVLEELHTTRGRDVMEQAMIDYRLVDLRHTPQRVLLGPFRPTIEADGWGWTALIEFLDLYELAQVKMWLLNGSLWAAREEVRMPGRRVGWPPSE